MIINRIEYSKKVFGFGKSTYPYVLIRLIRFLMYSYFSQTARIVPDLGHKGY